MPTHTPESRRFAKFLGKGIRAARSLRGVKIEALALECNISQATLSNIELGENLPNLITFVQISQALNIPMWEIVRAAERQWNRDQESC
jgi:transcriptional regulator with XRE-family HTH domain